ncbi:MAG: DNA repair protein RecN [Candidatus Velthaea sp.]
MGRPDQTGIPLAVRLLRLCIDDFGLIAHAAFEFSDGLTVFTGETGSGKTMLLGALGFVLGDRAESDMIRAGAERARVVLEIEPDEALHAALAAWGITLAPDDDVIVTRELLGTGRSVGRINGVAASASQLREIAGRLVDVVGQHEAQRLLAPAFALDVVDRFGGAGVLALRGDVRQLHRTVQSARDELGVLRDDDGRALAQIEFARYAAAEIDGAAIEDGEDERLRERRDVLANAERIAGALTAASGSLEDEDNAIDALGAAARALGQIARYGERFEGLAAALGALQSDANELAARLARERERAEADPAELETIHARLETIDKLKKKYGGSIGAIRETREQFAQTIDRDTGRDARIAALEERLGRSESDLAARAAELGRARRGVAHDLEALVARELAALAMPAARFSVAFEPLPAIAANGAERAELRLAANPGEPERPVAKSASGGELSRVLLALIVVLADRRERTALVFDEIDAGIGGATGGAVGARLGRLARSAQVIVVTHLAQIASHADAHYALRKHEAKGTTMVELETLAAHDMRLAEIARMLSGEATAVSLEHAATLVAGARAG